MDKRNDKLSFDRRRTDIIEFFKTMEKFDDVDSIPSLPKLSKEDYDTYIVPNVIRCGGIPKKDLRDGCRYKGGCRNTDNATWNESENRFVYTRYKFGTSYQDEINHFEDDDGFDLFVPIEIIEESSN